jgi:hypothetical protein
VLAPLASMQLAAWEALARGWQIYRADGSAVERCARCGHGIALMLDDQGRPYRYSEEQWLALVVLHLRNHHADLDPN